MRTDPYRKQRIMLTAALCIVLAIILIASVFVVVKNLKERKAEIMLETQTEEPAEGSLGQELIGSIGESLEEGTVTITNLSEYAAGLGWNAGLLTERLTAYVAEQGIPAGAGTIFHVIVPENDPDSVCYYVCLDDEEETICMLSWHKNESLVTASGCSYTKEEILGQIWEEGSAPMERDITPEDDAVFWDQNPNWEGGIQ